MVLHGLLTKLLRPVNSLLESIYFKSVRFGVTFSTSTVGQLLGSIELLGKSGDGMGYNRSMMGWASTSKEVVKYGYTEKGNLMVT